MVIGHLHRQHVISNMSLLTDFAALLALFKAHCIGKYTENQNHYSQHYILMCF